MEENKKKEKRQRRGLYFALAVCLIAIAVAGSATYSSVMDYVNAGDSSQASALEDKDPESQVRNEAERNSPSVSIGKEAGEESTESVNAQPNYEEPEEPEEPQDESGDDTEEAGNTEPTYTPSETLGFPVKATDIYRPFSGGALVYSETMKDYRVHAGADLVAQQGETVCAIGNGLVKGTYKDLLAGNVVEIEHGDYTVKYCGLGDTFLVSEGDVVDKGTAIGSIFETPFEQDRNAHIHIEIMQNGAAVDPSTVMVG